MVGPSVRAKRLLAERACRIVMLVFSDPNVAKGTKSVGSSHVTSQKSLRGHNSGGFSEPVRIEVCWVSGLRVHRVGDLMFGRKSRIDQDLRGVDLFTTDLLTPELKQLIVIGSVELTAKNAAAVERWHIGSSERWSADLVEGTIEFHFPDYSIFGPVEMLGTYSVTSKTWLWGWANDSIPPHVRKASQATKLHGEQNDVPALSQRKLNLPEPWLADDLAAVSVEIADLAGMYRGPTTNGYTYLGFSDFRQR